jgi:transcriptional regulator with PAS, ATPase and Fis domain
LRRKDGSYVTVLKNARVVRRDQEHALCAVEVQSDLTKLQKNQQEIFQLRSILEARYGFHGIVGASPAIRNLWDLVKKAAASEAPILIIGESGTGKELVAKAIHKLGKKSKGPFIRVSCAALSESLLESELFGHVKGAFTGASRTAKGRFEAAHTGDIFLDEVGDIPLSTQVKLLRVIQEKEFERVGDYRPIPIDVRVIAATNRDLRILVREGLFREDLFYRLNVIPICIPPLRARREDIPLLLTHFIRETAVRTGKNIIGVDREAMEFLTRYGWPGNVRELINVIEYAFVVCTGEVITRSDLPEVSPEPLLNGRPTPDSRPRPIDKERLMRALVTARGKRAEVARILGVSRQTVWTWIKKYAIDVKRLLSTDGGGSDGD